ncbi:hypothetical protein [Tenacibaculum halocynthiae]|uniref:hypothetical protein n=1 Tax=Tenacibaculum halocynthiae TaxID=1254437 RepID=UPI003D6612E6
MTLILKKHLLLIFLAILFVGCGLKTYKLKNGYSKAATNKKVYSNKVKFNESLLKNIDTTVIYEEFNTVSYFGLEATNVNIVARKNYRDPYTNYEVYRFYKNGLFNLFILNRNDSILQKEMFDPLYTGWRGVLYKEKEELKGDLITQVSGTGTIGKITINFQFKGDTLFVSRKNKWNDIYIKRKIPTELLNHKAEW